MANGTFYLYLKDKDALVHAPTLRLAIDLNRKIGNAMTDVTDAVERVARGTRHFIELAASEPDWGWAVFRALTALPRRSGPALGGICVPTSRSASSRRSSPRGSTTSWSRCTARR